MCRQIINLALVLLSLFCSSCLQLKPLNHQPAMARSKAEEFADAAFIEHDLKSAYHAQILVSRERCGSARRGVGR